MVNKKIIRVKTISEGHRLQHLPSPAHPLITVVDLKDMSKDDYVGLNVIFDFYTISLKKDGDKLPYGQQTYDYDEGVLGFMAPNQILSGTESSNNPPKNGWMLFFHPDLLWGTPLAKKIKSYDFFDYTVNEALFLSEKEESIINGIVENIKTEYNANIDKFSQEIIVSHIETLLNYAQRFYERQFITRKVSNSKMLTQVEEVLSAYFDDEDMRSEGLPSVQYVADALNISSKYLSSLLKQLTGLSTQQHIHNMLIDKAKEKLSTTHLTVSEIAYELGFEHSQSFNKFFKTKTKQSPLEFRKSFN